MEQKLAYLGFGRVEPAIRLQPYIRTYWYFRRDTPLNTYHEEFMHPSGGFGIVFNLGDAVTLAGETVHHPLFLDGCNTISRKMGFNGRVDLIGVRFYPGGAYPFLDQPLTELQNEIGLLDALNDPTLMQLYARLCDVPTLTARIYLLEQWLIQRLLKGKERHHIIPASLNKLNQSGHLFHSIPDMARDFAISQRQLERLYQAQVGMSPIQYSQLQRIEAARMALKEPNDLTNTQLAMALGFYDQSHFIREFKAVVGMTPYRYMKRSLDKAT